MTFYETNKDDSPQAIGSHGGADAAAVLYDADANFLLVLIGVTCYNTTQETDGLVTATTRNTLTVAGITWDNGDEYEVYCTATKNSFIGKFAIGRIYGQKLKYNEEEEQDVNANESDYRN